MHKILYWKFVISLDSWATLIHSKYLEIEAKKACDTSSSKETFRYLVPLQSIPLSFLEFQECSFLQQNFKVNYWISKRFLTQFLKGLSIEIIDRFLVLLKSEYNVKQLGCLNFKFQLFINNNDHEE